MRCRSSANAHSKQRKKILLEKEIGSNLIIIYMIALMLSSMLALNKPSFFNKVSKSRGLLKRSFHFLPNGAIQASGAELFNKIIDNTRHDGNDVRAVFADFVAKDAVEHSHDKYIHTIVDVGCGVGSLTGKLVDATKGQVNVLGVDSSKKMIEEARRRHGGGDDNNGKNEHLRFVTMNGADLSRVRFHFSVSTASFLFHELPPKAQFEVLLAMMRTSDITYVMDVNPSSIDLPVLHVFRLFEPFIEDFARKFDNNLQMTAFLCDKRVERMNSTELPELPASLAVWRISPNVDEASFKAVALCDEAIDVDVSDFYAAYEACEAEEEEGECAVVG